MQTQSQAFYQISVGSLLKRTVSSLVVFENEGEDTSWVGIRKDSELIPLKDNDSGCKMSYALFI